MKDKHQRTQIMFSIIWWMLWDQASEREVALTRGAYIKQIDVWEMCVIHTPK